MLGWNRIISHQMRSWRAVTVLRLLCFRIVLIHCGCICEWWWTYVFYILYYLSFILTYSYFTSNLNCSLTCPSFLPLTTLFSNNNGFSMRGFKWKSMKQRRHVVQRCEDFGCGRKLVADGVDWGREKKARGTWSQEAWRGLCHWLISAHLENDIGLKWREVPGCNRM